MKYLTIAVALCLSVNVEAAADVSDIDGSILWNPDLSYVSSIGVPDSNEIIKNQEQKDDGMYDYRDCAACKSKTPAPGEIRNNQRQDNEDIYWYLELN